MSNKFRVWDKQQSKYCDNAHLRFDDNGIIHIFGGGLYANEPDRYTVEFFTGFSDKNGREIYEGDMLRRKHEVGVVQFVNGQWVIMRKHEFGSVAYQADEFKIIGTVHDNSSEKANSSGGAL